MGLTLDIDVSELTWLGDKLHREVSTGNARAVRVTAEYAERQAKSRAPKKTGALQEGVKTLDVRRTTNQSSASVVSTAPHTEFVVADTEPHQIRARRKKSLHWISGGKSHFAQSVNHPGTKAQPFMLEAARTVDPVLEATTDRTTDDAIARAMK